MMAIELGELAVSVGLGIACSIYRGENAISLVLCSEFPTSVIEIESLRPLNCFPEVLDSGSLRYRLRVSTHA